MFGKVPSEPIIKVVMWYLRGEGYDDYTDSGGGLGRGLDDPLHPLTALCDRAKVHIDTMNKHIVGRSKSIDFNIADRLMCAMNLQHLWWSPELKDIYLNVKLDYPEVPDEMLGGPCRKKRHVLTKKNASLTKAGGVECRDCMKINQATAYRNRVARKKAARA